MFYFAAIIHLSVFYNNFENACIGQKILSGREVVDMKKEPFRKNIFREWLFLVVLWQSGYPDFMLFTLCLLLQGFHQLVEGCSGIGASALQSDELAADDGSGGVGTRGFQGLLVADAEADHAWVFQVHLIDTVEIFLKRIAEGFLGAGGSC